MEITKLIGIHDSREVLIGLSCCLYPCKVPYAHHETLFKTIAFQTNLQLSVEVAIAVRVSHRDQAHRPKSVEDAVTRQAEHLTSTKTRRTANKPNSTWIGAMCRRVDP